MTGCLAVMLYNISRISPLCTQCMAIASGRVVLALEGGYSPLVTKCATNCIGSLILPHGGGGDDGDMWASAVEWIAADELNRPPRSEAVSSIMATVQHHSRTGWQCFSNVSESTVAMLVGFILSDY